MNNPAPAQASFQADATATRIFSEVIPAEDRPTAESKLLEVVMVWSDTIIGIGHYQPKDGPVTVGDDPKSRFKLSHEAIPQGTFKLLTPAGDGWQVHVPAGTSGRVKQDGGEATAVGAGERSLGLHDQLVVSIGDVHFVVRYVRPSGRLVTNAWETLDFYFTKVLSTSFLGHAAFFLALLLTPIHTDRLSEDLFSNPNRFAKLIIQPVEKEVKKKFTQLAKLEEKKDETTFGKKEEVKELDIPTKKGAPVVDINKREEDKKKVMKSGLLAALNKTSQGAGSNVFGGGGLGTGINNALGGLAAGEGAGDAGGVGGLGSRGVGPGGGGGGLGIGGLGTKGGGGGGGGGMGVNLGGRGKAALQIDRSAAQVVGGLEKEVIARIVSRHQNEIKYCYERELQKDPNLYGKVAVMWIIDATGAVSQSSIAQSTMGNSNVENCLLQRVKRWKFPQPKGGGIVQVTYPWIFKPSN